MKYKHIFFDLDRTLWDFDINSHETLLELFNKYKLNDLGVVNYQQFIDRYQYHNNRLWELYRIDEISQKDLRRERFQRALADFGIQDFRLSEDIGERYIEVCPRKDKLFPFTIELLDYLKNKYILHIITNGFEKTQYIKLEHSNLMPYFNQIITSEKVGFKKPNPKIFELALYFSNARTTESIYIGDDLVIDILGCQNSGIDGIYFNPKKKSHNENLKFEVSCLSQIMDLL
tara:strand:+ start:180 stop:872 length:693 start_codon:yes stop_codon:yes gene_type:complete